MDALILKTKDKASLKLFAELARNLGVNVSSAGEDQLDDVALGALMQSEKTGRNVGRASVMKRMTGK